VAKPEATLDQCQAVITQVQEPVVASCDAGDVTEVKHHLSQVEQPLHVLSISFSLTSFFTIRKEVVHKYSYAFVKVLTKFQAVLTVIDSYPKIAAGCTDAFAKMDQYFDNICTVFKKRGEEIYQQIHQEASFNVTIWATAGFTFQSKAGYDSSSSISD